MSTKPKKKRKERNARLPKEEIDILEYEPLIGKILHKLAKKHGPWVYRYKEELHQEGFVGLIQAYNRYDPTRGTYVTIAYLRVWSAMQKVVNKEAKRYVKTEHLEEMRTSGKSSAVGGPSVNWQDLIPSHEVNYGAVLRLAVPDEKDRELMNHVIGGTLKKDLPKAVGLTVRATKESLKRVREDILAVCNEMYLESSKLKVRG